ncbi:multidrug ABC transporter ATPase [Microbacterium sp. nov. GSS16]|uniref:multidrug ABC transporter ATPase n=1 Tax=Microbacterium sp. nov. GSS16 TaxID=3019890 RepID=UPI00230543EA|nr:multidrug ABC transporter ATPase [Microbacterium sp. nov. GSS16]WCD91585.1 multidrug ABC transporter ATPase [Microbacterium sp. nov. GSS16]
MSKHDDLSAPQTGRLERFLAFTALALAAVSVICFFSIIIGTAVGMDQSAFGHGIWPVVAALPLFGLPIAFLMIITLLVLSWARRGRAGSGS